MCNWLLHAKQQTSQATTKGNTMQIILGVQATIPEAAVENYQATLNAVLQTVCSVQVKVDVMDGDDQHDYVYTRAWFHGTVAQTLAAADVLALAGVGQALLLQIANNTAAQAEAMHRAAKMANVESDLDDEGMAYVYSATALRAVLQAV